MEDNNDVKSNETVDTDVVNPVEDTTIPVEAKLLVNLLNLIHKDHAEVIDNYSQLFNVIVKSGKLQK